MDGNFLHDFYSRIYKYEYYGKLTTGYYIKIFNICNDDSCCVTTNWCNYMITCYKTCVYRWPNEFNYGKMISKKIMSNTFSNNDSDIESITQSVTVETKTAIDRWRVDGSVFIKITIQNLNQPLCFYKWPQFSREHSRFNCFEFTSIKTSDSRWLNPTYIISHSIFLAI